jgi:CheY-like chemotaxis protein
MAGTSESPATDNHILVVDDDLHTREAVMEGLRSRGYQVKGAADGLQALHHLQREPFNVVVTDIQMPRMDGVELLHEILRKGYAAVVVQTTSVDPYVRDMLRRAGASEVLAKSEPIASLAHVVDEICRKNRESSPRTT